MGGLSHRFVCGQGVETPGQAAGTGQATGQHRGATMQCNTVPVAPSPSPLPPPLTRFLFSVICGVSDCTAACTDASLCHTALAAAGGARSAERVVSQHLA